MTVFKTFLKILNKNKFVVILYTVILLVFGISNMQTENNAMNFVATKPDVLIVNNDEEKGITKDLIKYITKNSSVVQVEKTEEKINDALFYRDVNYVIYIPEGYNADFMNGENPEIEIKSTGDYMASFEEMILKRYIRVANIYQKSIKNEDELIQKINETLSKKAQVEIASKLDTDAASKASQYYNFASYSILACLLLVVGLILNTFNEEKIRKRIIISSTNYKAHNKMLLLSNCCYSVVLWLFYVVISFFIIGDFIFTKYGLVYIINSFLLTICATTIAFFIGNFVNNKEAINGIVNVVALGSSFLCGAFVPMEMLPNFVIKIAHLLPTYYYIKSNDILKTLEEFNFETLKPIFINMGAILAFSLLFIVLTNMVSKKKNRVNE